MGTIFDFITVSNNIGTADNDSISITSPYVASWGKQGNDNFISQSRQFPVFLIGGNGNDTYILDGISSAIIAEYGTQESSLDTLVLQNIPNALEPWYSNIIDKRHLFLYKGGEVGSNMNFLILDFFSNSNSIDYIDFKASAGGLTGKYSAEALRQYIVSSGDLRESWDEADRGDLYGFLSQNSITSLIINDTISLLRESPDTPIFALPTYILTPSASPINEGGTLTTTISTTGVTSGTILYYTLTGTGITTTDFSSGPLIGEVTVGTNGSTSFSQNLSSDLTSEGDETLQINLFSDAARTLQVGSTAAVIIGDTSINEGGTLTTRMFPPGRVFSTFYYELSGPGITSADFRSGSLTGEVNKGFSGVFLSFILANDRTTEGTETIQIKLFSDAARTLQVASTTTASVGDTSTTPSTNNTPTGTPALSGNIKAGQVVTIDSTLIQDADNFSGYTPSYNYSFEVSNDNATSWTKLTSTDATDNNSTYTLTTAEVGKSIRGVVSYLDGYGTNESVVSDASASITDPSPTYNLTPSATSVNEGSTISYTLTTSNVASGTSLYYQFSGTGINAADFSSATTTGTEVVGSNGQLTISRTLVADKTTEGTESLTLRVFADSGATTALATISALTVNDTSLTPVTPTQNVYTEKSAINYKPTGTILAPLLYKTSTGDSNLSGLTLNVHYNSSILTPSGSNNGVSGQVAAAISSTTILADTSNSDNDPLTDKILQLLWATFDNSFPEKTLPASLATVSFSTSATKTDALTGQPLSTTVRYTASETASGYDFITGSTLFKAQQFNLDVDGDGKVTALGDGLMVIRKLFGAAFSGDALTYKAISPNATRTNTEIHDFIQQGIDGRLLDVDKDGKTTGLGDGLMVIRRLFGAAFDGAALTNKAISPNSPYFGQTTDFNSVGINIDALKPTLI